MHTGNNLRKLEKSENFSWNKHSHYVLLYITGTLCQTCVLAYLTCW